MSALKAYLEKGLQNKPIAFLKMIIILWALMVIAAVLLIHNPVLLIGIALYEMLP